MQAVPSDDVKRPSQGGWIRPFEAELAGLSRIADVFVLMSALWLVATWHGEFWHQAHSTAAAMAGLFFMMVSRASGLHRPYRGRPLSRELRSVWVTWSIVSALLLFAAFITKTTGIHSRRVVMSWLLFAPLLLSLWRGLVHVSASSLRANGRNSRTAVVVGQTALGCQVARNIQASRWMGLRLLGFIDDRSAARETGSESLPAPFLGDFDQLVDDARSGIVDVVYVALPARAEPRMVELVRRLADTTASVHLAFDFAGFHLQQEQWASLGGVPTVAVVEAPFTGPARHFKRMEDIVLGGIICVLIALPMLIIAIAIKMTSHGPVFFRQRRYGLGGEEIHVLKFRTMTVCEDGDHVVQAVRGDSRVTRVGAFLRRTSLDEFPQFLQVFVGTMSIVGPRPHAVAHNEEYRSRIDGYMLRHKVKPGITGWAQVNGWRGETDTLDKMKMRVEHDLHYIRNWRLGLDLKIIALTAIQALRSPNNY